LPRLGSFLDAKRNAAATFFSCCFSEMIGFSGGSIGTVTIVSAGFTAAGGMPSGGAEALEGDVEAGAILGLAGPVDGETGRGAALTVAAGVNCANRGAACGALNAGWPMGALDLAAAIDPLTAAEA
jgi:hypothetical protein